MSFLLDALGKADDDRRRAEVPELRNFRRPPSSPLGRALRAFVLLLVLGLVFALGYFSRPYVDQLLADDQAEAVAAPAATVAETAVQLPAADTQTAESKLELEVISWSPRQQARFAMIDGIVLHEGDELESGERLLEIENEAVVLQRADGEIFRLEM